MLESSESVTEAVNLHTLGKVHWLVIEREAIVFEILKAFSDNIQILKPTERFCRNQRPHEH